MKTIPAVITCACLLLLCSCATTPHATATVSAAHVPVEVPMNEDAGRGNWMTVTVRLQNGEEVPFGVDTGSSYTLLDQSLVPLLGKKFGTGMMSHFNDKIEVGVYAAPRLYLGNIRLATARKVGVADLGKLLSIQKIPFKGIIGMDCLGHYCVQLDFEAGKFRFLYPSRLNTTNLGAAFPLVIRGNRPFIHQPDLIGGPPVDVLIDTGRFRDGASDPQLFHDEIREHKLLPQKSQMDNAWLPFCVWNGNTYTNVFVGMPDNSIGLRFLARHLVTFDFPNRTMYLKQTSTGPLQDEHMQAAGEFVNTLKGKGQLPGCFPDDKGTLELEAYVFFDTFDFEENNSSSVSHYRVTRISGDSPWKLVKAWQTDVNGKVIREYPVQ